MFPINRSSLLIQIPQTTSSWEIYHTLLSSYSWWERLQQIQMTSSLPTYSMHTMYLYMINRYLNAFMLTLMSVWFVSDVQWFYLVASLKFLSQSLNGSKHIWPIPNILRPRPGPRLLLAQISVRTKTWTVSVLMARTETVRDRAWSPLQWPVPGLYLYR